MKDSALALCQSSRSVFQTLIFSNHVLLRYETFHICLLVERYEASQQRLLMSIHI